MSGLAFPFSPTRRGLLIGGAACLVAAGPAWGQEVPEPRFFRLAAGPLGSAAFGLATALATSLSNPLGGRGCDKGGSCGVPGLIVVAQGAAQGPARALDLLRGGQAEGALVFARDLAAWLSAGDAGAQETLRALATLSAETLHVFVRQDDPAESLGDLVGQPLVLAQGPDAGTGLARQIIGPAHLLKPGQRALLMPLDFALDALAEGEVRAAFATLWPGNALAAQRARSLPLKLLPVTALSSQRVLSAETLPGALYPGVAEVDTVGQPLVLVVRADTADDFAEAFVRSLWAPTTLKALTSAGPVGQFALAGAQRSAVLAYHPGAGAAYAALLKKDQ